jgi:Dna[CI] antecedent, DciA
VSWHPERIADAARAELGRVGGGGPMAEVVASWPAAVGAAIAENAWPARFARDGTLHVAVSSSVWAFELTQLEAEVRNRLAEALGDRVPLRLRFAVGPLPDPGREDVSSPSRVVPEVSAAARQAGEAIAAPIGDHELRGLVARAAAVSLERARKRADDRPLW